MRSRLLMCFLLILLSCAPALAQAPGGDSAVRASQLRLKQLGYLAAQPDGGLGDETVRALALFQSANQLSPTGALDEATLAALHSEGAVGAGRPAMAVGSKGDRVVALQRRLQLLGFYSGVADGYYGKGTGRAVRELKAYISAHPAYQGEENALLRAVDGASSIDPLVLEALDSGAFPNLPQPSKEGMEGMDVRRIQTRLYWLGYLDETPDGGFGAQTARAVEAFQRRNAIKPTGKAGDKTLKKLFSNGAIRQKLPYKLVIRRSEQELYVYGAGKNERYEQLKHTFTCSTGAPSSETRAGSYGEGVYPVEEWRELDGGRWARYIVALDSDLLLHSTYFSGREGAKDSVSVAALGTAVTGGEIVLREADAKWIYEKCPRGTPVVIE